MGRLCVGALLLVSIAGPAVPESRAQGALSALQGSWAATAAERDGKPAADVIEHRLVFAGDTFTIRREDKTLYRGIYTVDTDRKPARIDFRHTQGSLDGKTWRGIYQLTGNTLVVCDNAPDLSRPRPTRLAAPARSGYICITFTGARR